MCVYQKLEFTIYLQINFNSSNCSSDLLVLAHSLSWLEGRALARSPPRLHGGVLQTAPSDQDVFLVLAHSFSWLEGGALARSPPRLHGGVLQTAPCRGLTGETSDCPDGNGDRR